MKRKYKVLIGIGIIIVTLVSLALIWLSNSYKATNEVNDYLVSTDTVEVIKDKSNYYTFNPINPKGAIIFYPGGKVDNKAYIPLLFELAEEGYLTILLKFPFNLAVFDINAASKVRGLYPEIEDWYLAGHSLGGSMAASHLSKNVNDYKGLILLGSYSTADLSNTSLNVLSLYGEFDQVMNKKNYDKNLSNLPNPKEYIIKGGNHSHYAYYGDQKGDGKAIIDRKEQINLTVTFIINDL